MKVGFVGVGALGSAMARRALQVGFEVVVYDVHPPSTDALEKLGASVAASPRELAEACSIAAVVVLDDAQVREVVCGAQGLLSAEGGAEHIVIHSTIQLPTLFEVEAAARAGGRVLIDAGVSGSVKGAEDGKLAVMVGGAEEAIRGCRPLLDAYGGLVVRVGDLGVGMKAKVARNTVSFGQCAVLFEAMRLAEESGVDLGAFAQIVRHSEAISGMVEGFLGQKTVRPPEGGRPGAAYVSNLARKDLGAALELAASLGIAMPVAAAARDEAVATWGGEPGPKA